MPSPRPPSLGRALRLAACAALLLALGGCQSEEATTGRSAGTPAAAGGRSTDPGGRYLDAGGPIGGLTAETPPGALRAAP